MPKCDFCKQETSSPVRARREFKTFAGESKYIYILACLDCFGRMDWVDGALEVLGDDGQPLELERSSGVRTSHGRRSRRRSKGAR